MKHPIGVTSDRIHRLVCKSDKPLTISYLMTKLKTDPRKIMIAVGWLYRGGLIELEEKGLRIYLRGRRCGRYSEEKKE